MSEIEKLYENVEITKIGNRKCTPAEFLDCQNYCFISENNKCDKYSYGYPPFTAEKQLELIKWLIQKNFYDERIIRSNYEKTHFYCSYIYCESEQFEKFEEALANIFNYFWQDLTKEEKEQVRGILNE